MRASDWKVISSVCTTLGAIFLLGSFLAYGYGKDVYWFGVKVDIVYPYRGYFVPLLIASITLLVIGIASSEREKEERKLEAEETPKSVKPSPQPPIKEVKQKYCRHCGAPMQLDDIYCTKCGKDQVPRKTKEETVESLKTLRIKLAKGEITPEEYERLKKQLKE